MSTFTPERPRPHTSAGSASTRPPMLVALTAVLALLTTLLIPPGSATANGADPCAATEPANGTTSTAGHLMWLASSSSNLGGDFVQTADIDLTGCTWTPIGNSTSPFSGRYDGGGNTITGLDNGGSTADQQGFFGVTRSATLIGIHLEDLTVSGGEYDVGGLVGSAVDSAISDSSVTGTVSGAKDAVGALVGRAEDTVISNSSGTGAVEGGESVGGLVGRAERTAISDSSATGTVTGGGSLGGLVGGAINGVTIEGSSATSQVTGTVDAVGGLVGYLGEFDNGASTIRDSVATGTVTGVNSVGGLVGYADADTGPITISNSSATGTVDGVGEVGGLVGMAYLLTIEGSSASGGVTGTTWVGGLVGDAAGYYGEAITIRHSAATSDVTGEHFVGGLVGVATAGEGPVVITGSYARGEVQGLGSVGGLVGASLSAVTISTSYATGLVAAPTDATTVGGLLGDGSATAESSFWDTESTGQPSSAGVEAEYGKPTAQMRDITTFADAAWPIVADADGGDGAVWGICSAANDGYPFLLWQAVGADCTVAPSPSPSPSPLPAPVPAPAPVRDAGSGDLPVMSPGRGEVLIGGQPAPVAVTPVTEEGVSRGVSISGDGFEIRLEATDADAARGSGGAIGSQFVVAQGEGVHVELSGFAPDSLVRVWLFSEPALLGEFMTYGAGALAARVAMLPEGVSPCQHTVQVVGHLPGGAQVAANLGVWVTANPFPFDDTVAVSTHGPAVGCLASLGVVEGFGVATYGPQRPLSRGQAATMVTRLLDLERFEPTFAGAIGSTHETAIGAVQAAGLMSGFGDGMFQADAPITRGQLASVLATAYGLEPQDAPFPDAGSTHAGALGALHQAGVLAGFVDGSVRPGAPITRGQAASALVRARQLLR